jgi:hypothetical protein
MCSYLASYLVVLIGREGFLQSSDEVFTEHGAVSHLDLLPLGRAPVSQEAAQTARLIARTMDLSAYVLKACSGRRMRGHVRHRAC